MREYLLSFMLLAAIGLYTSQAIRPEQTVPITAYQTQHRAPEMIAAAASNTNSDASTGPAGGAETGPAMPGAMDSPDSTRRALAPAPAGSPPTAPSPPSSSTGGKI